MVVGLVMADLCAHQPRDQAAPGQHHLALAGYVAVRTPDDGRTVARIDIGFPGTCRQLDAEPALHPFSILEARVVAAHGVHCRTLQARSPTKAFAVPTSHRGTRATAVLARLYIVNPCRRERRKGPVIECAEDRSAGRPGDEFLSA